MAQDNKITNKEIEQFFKEISTAELTEDEIMKAFLEDIQKDINIKRKILDDTMNNELDKIKEIHLRLTENR